jgi:DNA-binding GntR family transcriptional regulator
MQSELRILRDRAIAADRARTGRAEGAAMAREARTEKKRKEDQDLAARISGLKRRENLSERGIARRMGVSRGRVRRILVRTDS